MLRTPASHGRGKTFPRMERLDWCRRCVERRFTALTPAPVLGSPIPHLSSVFQEIPPKVKFLQLPLQRSGTSPLAPSLPQLLPSGPGGSWWLLPGGTTGSLHPPPLRPHPPAGTGIYPPPREDPLGFTRRLVVRDVLEHGCSIKSLRIRRGGQSCWYSNIFY